MTSLVIFDQLALAELLESEDGPVAKDLLRRGIVVQAAAKRSIRHHGTGRVYRRGNVTHQASAPGEPPATDRGRLIGSITPQLGKDDKGLVERVGTDVEYALPLERGTRFMEPRPFLLPALQQASR